MPWRACLHDSWTRKAPRLLREYLRHDQVARTFVTRSRLLALRALAVLLVGSSAGADDSVDAPRWSPSLSVGMLAHVQDVNGKALSTFPERQFFDPSVNDDPLVLIPAIPVGLQLKGPGFRIGGRSLRPFIHGRVQFPMDQDQTVLRQGTVPNPVQIPDDISSTQPAGSLSGQGTILVATFDVTGQVGLGVALDIEIFDLPFTMAASLDYLVEQVTLDGTVVYATGAGPGETQPYTIQRLEEKEHALFHYLGPRFEIEAFAAEHGPFHVSVFAEAGGFVALGDRSKSYSARDATDSARFDFEVDRWLIQAGVGVRLTWAGGSW